MGTEEVKLREVRLFYLKKTFRIWCQHSLIMGVTSVNSMKMPLVWGSLIEGDLERGNTFLTLFSSIVFYSSFASSRVLFHSFHSIPVMPQGQGLKKAYLISVAHIWTLGKSHRTFPVQPSPSCSFLKHSASLSVVNLDFLVLTTKLDNPLCLPRIRGYISNPLSSAQEAPYLGIR